MNDQPEISDQVLLERITQGSEDAFRKIFERHRDRVFNLAYRYAGSLADAEEITQDVFIKIFKKAGTFQHRSKFTTWLYRITVNTCLNYKRRQQINIESIEAMAENGLTAQEPVAPDSANPEAIYRRRQKAKLIRQALDQIPAKSRLAFILNKFEGYSYDEISEVLGTNRNTVAALIHRAKMQIKKILLPWHQQGLI